jgi:hypothetical protein
MNSQITFAASKVHQQELRRAAQEARMSGSQGRRWSFSPPALHLRFPTAKTARAIAARVRTV